MRRISSVDASHQQRSHVRLVSYKLRTEIKITRVAWADHKHAARFLFFKNNTARFIRIVLKLGHNATVCSNSTGVFCDISYTGQAQQPGETVGNEARFLAFHIYLRTIMSKTSVFTVER